MNCSSIRDLPLFFLWAVPRSVSTAFEKVMSQHPKIKIVHEPLTESYYFSEARRSDRYGLPAKVRPPLTLNLHSIGRFISPKRITFIKELAFQGHHFVSDACLKSSRHLVILRKPAVVYQSLVKIKPDFTEDEFGFTALECLLDRLDRLNRSPLAVFDGDNFRDKPETVLRRACVLMQIEFFPTMLSWKSGKIRSWTKDEALSQACWHTTLERSTTILPSNGGSISTSVQPKHLSIIRRAEGIYEQCMHS